ncbi:MAG TPA: hypothetical protein DEQ41_16800 [Shewanella sp.]|nr:hypothetical protein [Shewanella sp.]
MTLCMSFILVPSEVHKPCLPEEEYNPGIVLSDGLLLGLGAGLGVGLGVGLGSGLEFGLGAAVFSGVARA